MSTSSGLTDTVQQYAPWRRGIAWWVVLIQGLILLAIGGFALWSPNSAAKVLVLGIGIYLAAIGLWTIVQTMRGRDGGLSVFGLLAAGGGLVAGISVSVAYMFAASTSFGTIFFIFGVSLITIGILTLLAAFVERPEAGIVWMTMLRGIMWAALGGYMIYAVLNGVNEPKVVQWIAIAFLVLGALLAIFSVILNRQQAARSPVEAPQPAPVDVAK